METISNSPVFRSGEIEIPLPPRTLRMPQGRWELQYLAIIERGWARFCEEALLQLRNSPSPLLHPEAFTSRSMEEQFVGPQRKIKIIARITGRPDKISDAYKFFILGEKRDSGRQQKSSNIRMNHREIIQLKALTIAHDQLMSQVTNRDLGFDRLEHLMSSRPEGGGPLWSTRLT